MKTTTFLSLLLLGVITSFNSLKAQTSISILYTGDSTNVSYCHVPQQVFFFIYGTATGYTSADSITMYTNFGDGHDTTTKKLIPQNWFSDYCYHTYTAPGIYNVQYIATGPDGNADTLVVMGEVILGDTCGNISGKVFVDVNGDCLFNTGDLIMKYIPVALIYNLQTVAWAYTDSLGNYYFNAPIGNSYTVKMGSQLSSYGYSVSCPVSGQYAVLSFPSPGNDFGLTCLNGFDLQGNLSGWGFRPGFNATINPGFWNSFCLPVSGQAKLVINDPLLTYVSATNPPNQIIGDTLIWNFSNVSNSNYWSWWNNNLGTVHVLTSTNAVIGDTVCVTLIIVPLTGDIDPANNIVNACWAIRNSWDPNEKDVSPRGIDHEGYVAPGTEFTYTIQFQNLGTDTAFNIYVLDTLNTNLDISTYHPVASSHLMQADILTGNVLRFNFSNIMLVNSSTNEPLSHGWLTYQVSAKPGLVNGTIITNTAGIYFDFNPAVMTNTTLNTIDINLGISTPPAGKELNLQVFPNPAQNEVNIQTTTELYNAELTIINPLGQRIRRISNINGNKLTIDSKDFGDGIYFIVLKNKNTQTTGKFIIEK